MVSVFKHPLKPKKIRSELKSALKEVGHPAVPHCLQRCWDERPLRLGCIQQPYEQDAQWPVCHLKQPEPCSQRLARLTLLHEHHPVPAPGAEPSTGHTAAMHQSRHSNPFQSCDAANLPTWKPVPVGGQPAQ